MDGRPWFGPCSVLYTVRSSPPLSVYSSSHSHSTNRLLPTAPCLLELSELPLPKHAHMPPHHHITSHPPNIMLCVTPSSPPLQVEAWVARLLPSRLFGHIVLTTSAGIMDHEEARRKGVGGKVLGFFY